MTRPGWDEFFLNGARWLSQRGDCTRRQVGALISDSNHLVIGQGYNGTKEPGQLGCLDGACPRGRHYNLGVKECEPYPCRGCPCPTRCACGNVWPCPDAVAPGSPYDIPGPGFCEARHAEENALRTVADPARLDGAVMYSSESPCSGCVEMVRGTGISAVIWPGGCIAFP